MKMLTLWACMETSGEAAPATALDTTLAWKQAWKSLDPAATNPTSNLSPSGLPGAREIATGRTAPEPHAVHRC